ncbi:MAG: acylneuraminate cytidylyltransferase family protein [Candidatus Omnitrophica bacterium]|nr:acylneuraminate cytidylyltransferase family protein [Candidatus Omnitrophota bacterium]MDD5670013.1 acylneuraminate cytidylyltransferase family protein [Candidatus Omnitrophota bacterium]
MYQNHKILALIPARGGSKRFPRKNVKPLGGEPLIAWAIAQAGEAKSIDATVVSTDDKNIAAVSRKYHADVPFMRPRRFATDKAEMKDVVLHAMRWVETHREAFDLLVLLQPTSPLRLAADIENAVRLLFRKKAKAVVSVCESERPPHWMNILPENGCMRSFFAQGDAGNKKQALGRFYRLNGAIYLTYWDYFKKNKSFFGAETYAYPMPRDRSVDIDDRYDYLLAEAILKSRRKS